MRLKICDSHLTCKVANKCLDVRERVEVVEWNKRWSLPFPCESSVSVKENPDGKKKFSFFHAGWNIVFPTDKNSHTEVFCRKAFLKCFAMMAGVFQRIL